MRQNAASYPLRSDQADISQMEGTSLVVGRCPAGVLHRESDPALSFGPVLDPFAPGVRLDRRRQLRALLPRDGDAVPGAHQVRPSNATLVKSLAIDHPRCCVTRTSCGTFGSSWSRQSKSGGEQAETEGDLVAPDQPAV